MEKVFKKFFTNDKVLTIFSCLATSMFIALAIIQCVNEAYELVIFNGILAICIIGVYISYKKHEKNVMKALIGSIIMGLLFLCISVAFISADVLDNFVILVNVGTILILILFILNHYAINSDHHSNPYNIFINQVLLLIFAVLALTNIIASGFDYSSIIHNLCSICAIVVITCIESKLDAFREKREEGK